MWSFISDGVAMELRRRRVEMGVVGSSPAMSMAEVGEEGGGSCSLEKTTAANFVIDVKLYLKRKESSNAKLFPSPNYLVYAISN